jgi:hypothetical protein
MPAFRMRPVAIASAITPGPMKTILFDNAMVTYLWE